MEMIQDLAVFLSLEMHDLPRHAYERTRERTRWTASEPLAGSIAT